MTSEHPMPEELAGELTIREKRKIDSHTQAWILDSGRVVISSTAAGIETVLSPERAYALLGLLYSHRDLLHQLCHNADETGTAMGNQ